MADAPHSSVTDNPLPPAAADSATAAGLFGPGAHRLFVVGALLVAFALRLHNLGVDSLWYDEAVSVSLAQRSTVDLIARTAGDIHPPGYYLLLHAWRAASAPTLRHGLEFLYAWPSLAASLAGLALLCALGRRALGRPAALLAVILAALSPFQLWYAQEVRMYALAGALGLLCLWASLRWITDGSGRWLALLALASAAGMYVLYYFAFLLAGLTVTALAISGSVRRFLAWLGALAVAALLYLPWAGIMLRQVTDPPVPAWRAPWASLAEALFSSVEASASPLAGQTLPNWGWLAAAAVVLLSLLFAWRAPATPRLRWGFLAFLWVGPLLILLLTLGVTPLYHVRYLYPTSTVFPLIAAGALVPWMRGGSAVGGFGQGARRGVGAYLAWGGFVALLVIEVASLRAFWREPEYRADDHRGAIAALAEAWRPGDVILANAGWVTPLFDVYWPRPDPAGAPPPLDEPVRMIDLVHGPTLTSRAEAAPIVRSGSVEGDPALGWGDAQSDFFAVSRADTLATLDTIASSAKRLWHYRLYDTVSDPQGLIRTWLDENTDVLLDQMIPGRDFGRLELRAFDRGAVPVSPVPIADFSNLARLDAIALPVQVAAGDTLYAPSTWQALPGLQAIPAGLSLSLRLYDGSDTQRLQFDSGPLPPTTAWQAGGLYAWPLALRIPASTPPGSYFVDAVLYRQDDGAPIPPSGGESPDGQRLRLGAVEVTPGGP